MRITACQIWIQLEKRREAAKPLPLLHRVIEQREAAALMIYSGWYDSIKPNHHPATANLENETPSLPTKISYPSRPSMGSCKYKGLYARCSGFCGTGHEEIGNRKWDPTRIQGGSERSSNEQNLSCCMLVSIPTVVLYRVCTVPCTPGIY